MVIYMNKKSTRSLQGRFKVDLLAFLLIVALMTLLSAQLYELHMLRTHGPIPTMEWEDVDTTISKNECDVDLVFAIDPKNDTLVLGCPKK